MIIDNTTDTICAISTPPGVGGIAVARISGPRAIELTNKLWQGKSLEKCASHTAHLGTVITTMGEPLDQAVATLFRAPNSFTGQDVVEISVHGSKFVQRELLNSLIAIGCRMAQPGEFTRRAFASGRMDLAEAEAVADVIASTSRAAHRIAMTQMRGGYSRRIAQLRNRLVDLASLLELELDFSEEDVEFADRRKLHDLTQEIHTELLRLTSSFASGQAIKEGIPVAIVGATNAGKSSLLNALLGEDRAIVSEIHGTTRDTIEETIEIGDYLFRFIDTAGIRSTDDSIERIGISRSLDSIDKARIILCVTDSSLTSTDPTIAQTAQRIDQSPTPGQLLIVNNKTDIATPSAHPWPHIDISAKTGQGIDQLRDMLTAIADTLTDANAEDIIVTNQRHCTAFRQAAQSISQVIDGLAASIPPDLIAQDIRQTIAHLSEITGDIPSTEILQTIFARFCIGK